MILDIENRRKPPATAGNAPLFESEAELAKTLGDLLELGLIEAIEDPEGELRFKVTEDGRRALADNTGGEA